MGRVSKARRPRAARRRTCGVTCAHVDAWPILATNLLPLQCERVAVNTVETSSGRHPLCPFHTAAAAGGSVTFQSSPYARLNALLVRPMTAADAREFVVREVMDS